MKSRVQRGREQLKGIIQEFCRIELDVRGGVIECDPLRPSPCSNDSMSMNPTNESMSTEQNPTTEEKATGCCGGPAPQASAACCVRDAEVKATGGSGCGCAAKTATPTRKGCC